METEEVKYNVNEVIVRLAKLQTDMDYVREHIQDITLTEEDIESLEVAEEEYEEGRTISLQKLKKELNL